MNWPTVLVLALWFIGCVALFWIMADTARIKRDIDRIKAERIRIQIERDRLMAEQLLEALKGRLRK